MAGSSASQYFEIPKYFVFSQKGIFTGSASERDFNYKIVPVCPKEGDKSLCAYIWPGEKCLDKSENVTKKEFPLSEEGHAEMLKWLESEYLSRDEVRTKIQKQDDKFETIRERFVSLEEVHDHREELKAEFPK